MAQRGEARLPGTIAKRYPEVEVIEFQLTFVDPDEEEPLTVAHRRQPRHSAIFRFECPSRRCVGGGFDLDGPAHAMLREGEHRTEGRLACRGWRDRRRDERCEFEVRFVVWADYR